MSTREKYTKYIKPNLEKITQWVSDGEPEYLIAKKVGVNRHTWYKYKKSKVEFSKAIIDGQQNLTQNIESFLYKRCKGYTDPESGKHTPPSDLAIIFTLKNLDPDKWKDRQEIKQNINQKIENLVIDIEDDE